MIEITRKTKETEIKLKLNIYGRARYKINTGIKFFDHLLSALSEYSGMDFELIARGDNRHHIVEDVGIVLGQAINKAIKGIKYINRFGNFLMPMDEALSYVAVDISGRVFLEYDVEFPAGRTNEFDLFLIEEFFKAFCREAKITLHISLKKGKDPHHIAESIFKGFGVALAQALSRRKIKRLPSTKGKL